jgi:hypothetical protein
VAIGKKMMPSSGMSHVLNAAATKAGRATQMMNSANRGKSPANTANKQPIVQSFRYAPSDEAESLKFPASEGEDSCNDEESWKHQTPHPPVHIHTPIGCRRVGINRADA